MIRFSNKNGLNIFKNKKPKTIIFRTLFNKKFLITNILKMNEHY